MGHYQLCDVCGGELKNKGGIDMLVITELAITVNGLPLIVESGDEVHVQQEPCDICGHHTTITVDRNGKQIFEKEL